MRGESADNLFEQCGAELGGPGCVGGVGRVRGNEVSPSAQGTGSRSVGERKPAEAGSL